MNWKMKYYLINFEYDLSSNMFRFNTQKYLVVNNSEIIYSINIDDDTRNSGFYYYYCIYLIISNKS